MKGSDFLLVMLIDFFYGSPKKWSETVISSIDYPQWLETKMSTINPKIENNECFKNAVTVRLHQQQTINSNSWSASDNYHNAKNIRPLKRD